MAQVYFISADKLKEDTVISENTDNKLIAPTILMVQDIYIQNILGTSLYNELKAQIQSNSVSALNQTLLNEYLQNAIKYYCMAELCLPLTYKFMNKSIVTKNSENSTVASPQQLSQIKNYYLNHAEWYAKRIVKYLQENQTLYPLWLGGNTTIDAIQPRTNTYHTGMFLGNTRGGAFSTSLPIDKGELDCCD
jgi:response regulator of citrate/malate metabolism